MPNLVQEGLKRKVSDHAAIVLKEEVKNWGPKPFKFLNCWLEDEELRSLVEKEWKESEVNGWSGFVLKEKLKIVRDKIRNWHRNKFGQIDRNIELRSEAVKQWDDKMEVRDLDMDEAECRKKDWEELNKLIGMKDHIRFQQARSK